MTPPARTMLSGALVGLTAAALSAAVVRADERGLLPGGGRRWLRRNHRGDEVTLIEGVALSVGVAAPLVVLDPPVAAAVLLAAGAGPWTTWTGGRTSRACAATSGPCGGAR
ncbi:hypothetical protein [Serinicoccus sp. CUA-874]|uniref:hypothetical protein n=1 Tax=Serinicoccus sp. CUA-874 TaxID=1517939 RepID=UPI001EDC9164|nr:hypothetical protein [Serinicoccus sp. CUA-874]